MVVCTFDNPDTMCRECWQDGKLICSYSVHLLMQKGKMFPMFFGANIGDWKVGQLVGDPNAIGKEYELDDE